MHPMIRPAPSLVLPIPPGGWPPPRAAVTIDGVRLEPKPELHVTLVGRALGAELHAAFGNHAAALVEAAAAHAPAVRMQGAREIAQAALVIRILLLEMLGAQEQPLSPEHLCCPVHIHLMRSASLAP